MKDLIKEITEGEANGKIVWIYDFRHSDFNCKPDRRLEPTRVLVRSNAEITDRVNYSESHFIRID